MFSLSQMKWRMIRRRAFLQCAPVNILILNSENRIKQMSRAMAELANVSFDGTEGRALTEVLPSIVPFLQPSLGKALNGESVYVEFELEFPSHLGLKKQWSASCFPFGKSDIGIVITEITDRKRIEKAFLQAQRQLAGLLRDLERNSVVNEMAHLLHAANSSTELYNIVGRFGARLFPRSSGSLCIIDSSKSMIEVVAGWGEGSTLEPVFSLDDCWALREGRLHVVRDSTSELMCAHVAEPTGAQLCIPMIAQSETLGILHLRDTGSPSSSEAFAPAELRLIQRVAEEIGLPIANLRLRATLQYQALRDPLTGLYNRRFFLDTLHRELRRAIRKQSSIGIIMLDVDHFKQFNDSNGHAAGDALLRAVSAMLQSRVRGGDVLCRLGGDEFSILMPEANLEHTISRAEELRQALKRLNFDWHGQTLRPVTISSGAAAFPTHGATAETLLHEADAGLYLAKSSGRDQVVTIIPSASESAAG